MKVFKSLARVYVHEMEAAIKFYETIVGSPLTGRFKMEEFNIEVANIGDMLIIAGPEESLKIFRGTHATFLVDSLAEFRPYLLEQGSEIIRDVRKVPTGFNMTVRHPDGAVIEYVEFSNV